jgi:SynChlorMet cassette radical SAM/SPASM protein ScmF
VLAAELYCRIVDEAIPLGLTTVKLTGGEPLLHPRVDEMIEHALRRQLRVVLETNGVLLNPRTATLLASRPDSFVSVSLDGVDAATHDWMRGVDGAFDGAMRAIRLLTSVGTAPQIIMSVARRNMKQIAPMVRLAEDLGASSVKFNIVQPSGRGAQIADQATEGLTVPELVTLGRMVDTEMQDSTKLLLAFDYPVAFRPIRRLAQPDGCSSCGILGILGVLPTGHYALCGIGQLVPEMVFGLAGQDALVDVWNSSAVLREIREGIPSRLSGICGECLMRASCLGACIAQNYHREKSLWSAYWFCEAAADLGVFPASRLVSAGGNAAIHEGATHGA